MHERGCPYFLDLNNGECDIIKLESVHEANQTKYKAGVEDHSAERKK
jgi:hypothetical protein